MDLLGGLSLDSSAPSLSNAAATKANNLDLLGDLFGGSDIVPVTSTPPMLANLMGLAPVQAITCYNSNGLFITLTPQKENAQLSNILVTFSTVAGPITDISFQVAVPKV